MKTQFKDHFFVVVTHVLSQPNSLACLATRSSNQWGLRLLQIREGLSSVNKGCLKVFLPIIISSMFEKSKKAKQKQNKKLQCQSSNTKITLRFVYFCSQQNEVKIYFNHCELYSKELFQLVSSPKSFRLSLANYQFSPKRDLFLPSSKFHIEPPVFTLGSSKSLWSPGFEV